MERYEAIQGYQKGSLTVNEACIRCQIKERQFYRLVSKVKEAEASGKIALSVLVHGNKGRESNRKLTEQKRQEIKELIEKRYSDFGPTLATEKLEEEHGIVISSETLRKLMTDWGHWKPKTRRSKEKHRQWRERRSTFGEMQQFDGSYHAWFEDRGAPCCLLASIDDATNITTGLKFVEWEGVFASFDFWREYIEKHGKPGSVYVDKHSTYKVNFKHLLDDPEARTQFGRVCEELCIVIIYAHSPQAKGRIERLFETFQDRLVKELRMRGISTIEEANRFLEEEFIPSFNKKFSVEPRKEGDAHRVVLEDKETLDRIFSIHSKRVVMNDFTVQYKNRFFQLLPTTKRLVYKKEKVDVEERKDGSISISLRGASLPIRELPERPSKKNMKKNESNLLAHKKHKPAPDHPWRQYKQTQKKKNVVNIY